MKFIRIIIISIIVVLLIVLYQKYSENKVLENIEDYQASIDDYYIYGSHFNMSGQIILDSYDDLYLVLKNNKDEINLDYNIDGNKFYLSNYINDGLNLNNLKQGSWYLLFKQSIDGVDKYYSLSSTGDNMEYYSVSNNGNKKISLIFDNYKDKNYINFKVTKSRLPDDVYDIAIDPGHGGIDTGAVYNYKGTEYHESDLTLVTANLLKSELEKKGYKVLVTRDDDGLYEYGEHGRAVIPNKYQTKLTLSLHLNSLPGMINGGVEVYIPNNIDTAFAQSIADNIVENTNLDYSTRKTDKISQGVYYEILDSSDISSSQQKLLNKGLKPYDIIDNTPSMYMIREVGGKVTHAYVDDRNGENYNLYYDSLQTSESYLIELGYLNINNDLLEILNNKKKIIEALVLSIDNYLKD